MLLSPNLVPNIWNTIGFQLPRWKFIWECWDSFYHTCKSVLESQTLSNLLLLSCFSLSCKLNDRVKKRCLVWMYFNQWYVRARVMSTLLLFLALDEVLSVNIFVELDKVLGVERHIKVPQDYCHIIQFICIWKDWQDVYQTW